jgi:hypothetical protein
MHTYQEINGDMFMVNVELLVAATLYNLNSKLSRARARIIVALDVIRNGQGGISIPFTHMSTMLIQHHSHTSFHGHHHLGNCRGIHDPRAFHSAVDTIENRG